MPIIQNENTQTFRDVPPEVYERVKKLADQIVEIIDKETGLPNETGLMFLLVGPSINEETIAKTPKGKKAMDCTCVTAGDMELITDSLGEVGSNNDNVRNIIMESSVLASGSPEMAMLVKLKRAALRHMPKGPINS